MFTVGRLLTNCYITFCDKTKEAIIIDPGFDNHFEAEKILRFAEENTLRLKFILNTHGHPDHTCGNSVIEETFRVPIMIHEYDACMLGEMGKDVTEFFGFEKSSPPADMLLHDGDLVEFGKVALKVMHTPGHSHGSISLIGDKEVFTGDTLFMGSIGRTDFPQSSEQEMEQSLKKLVCLPSDFLVYPGHGPKTTLGEEKSNNPFLQFL